MKHSDITRMINQMTRATMPHYQGLNMGWWDRLWWRCMPGVTIKVRWPRGWVVLDESEDGSRVSADSADPNDHYRPWLEANVGRQGWDWNWQLQDSDIIEDQLTIKFRRKYEKYATIAVLRWA